MISQIRLVREGAQVPKRSTEGSIGFDVFQPEDVLISKACSIDTLGRIIGTLFPKISKIPLGIVIKPPEGFYFELVLRSSISKTMPGVSIPHSVGIIDPDFCGPNDELTLILENNSEKVYKINKGDRICQLILHRKYDLEFKELENGTTQEETSRGGLGSTGR